MGFEFKSPTKPIRFFWNPNPTHHSEMAKPPAGFHTPRPSSLRSTSIPRADLSSGAKGVLSSIGTRSSVGSSSSASVADLPASRDLASVAKVVAKRLAYDDDFTFPAATLPEEADLAPLLELPDPDSSSSTVISASPDDTMTASADSTVTEVAASADNSTGDSSDRPVVTEQRTEMELVLAELRGARGLSPRSKRLVAALVEVAAAELSSTSVTARRLRRAAFWGKVRVGVLAATVFAVAVVDVVLAVSLLGARRHYHHVLPPT